MLISTAVVDATQKQVAYYSEPRPPLVGVFVFLHPVEAIVARRPTDTDTQTVDSEPPHPQVAATLALAQARRYRHHKTCRCFNYGRLYCTAADALWSRAVDRELDKI